MLVYIRDIRGQLSGLGSLLLPCGTQGLDQVVRRGGKHLNQVRFLRLPGADYSSPVTL